MSRNYAARVPSVNEAGAWSEYWIPGGYTGGGVPEAVVDIECIKGIQQLLENITLSKSRNVTGHFAYGVSWDMIKNIVFDMGNVLTIYNAREYIYGYINNEEDFRWMKNHLCASVEWLKMDRGTISDEDAIASICRRMPEHLHSTVKRFINEYRMVQPPNPPMEKLVEELSQSGYDLYLLSNTSHRFRVFSQYIKSIPYMKGIWISCEHGLLKPEPEAYLDFFRTFSLDPAECFFIDDNPANIEAAGNLGMNGCVYYGDVRELRSFMRENGIKVSQG